MVHLPPIAKLACVSFPTPEGQAYLAAMAASSASSGKTNRQLLTEGDTSDV